jgi:hypothetical protein
MINNLPLLPLQLQQQRSAPRNKLLNLHPNPPPKKNK